VHITLKVGITHTTHWLQKVIFVQREKDSLPQTQNVYYTCLVIVISKLRPHNFTQNLIRVTPMKCSAISRMRLGSLSGSWSQFCIAQY